jgi:vacuolar-type H+-ATPase subunit C/Vma6
MIGRARFAFGNARIRARKSRLLATGALVALTAADRPSLTVESWRDIDPGDDAGAVLGIAYARLIDDYTMTIRAYPAGAPLIRALVRLHEVENVKLAWRAALRGVAACEWHAQWRPMGLLESVRRNRCTVSSLPQLIAALCATPFDAVAAAAWRAHGSDGAAAEMTIDRWASAAVAAEAAALPPSESIAARLAAAVVCERDAAVLGRAIATLGIAPTAAMRMTSWLGVALPPAGVHRLLTWSSAGGAPLALPRALSPQRRVVADFDQLRQALRAGRRAACRQAFLGDPYSLGPAIALLLLREDETRALVSLAELRAARASTADAARVLDFDG